MNILFLGAPGSGKSTQGQILAEKRGMKWLSSGQMFRESQDPEILKILETSQLVSDEITNRMMAKAIRENLDFGVILDGYPRTLNQVEYIFNEGIKIDMVVEIDVPVEELLKRLSERGRGQDTPEVIMERVELYKKTRDEIVNYCLGQGARFVEIDGNGTIEEISKKVEEEVR